MSDSIPLWQSCMTSNRHWRSLRLACDPAEMFSTARYQLIGNALTVSYYCCFVQFFVRTGRRNP